MNMDNKTYRLVIDITIDRNCRLSICILCKK